MPLYDYECPECQHHFQVVESVDKREMSQRCPRCETASPRVYHTGGPVSGIGPVEKAFASREGLTLDHINVDGEGPRTFRSKKELQKYCNKHGLESGALL